MHAQDAAADLHALDLLAFAADVRGHLDADVHGVAQETALGRLDRFDEPFARKGVRVDHREGTCVQGHAAGVLEPHRQPRMPLAARLAVDGDFISFHFRVDDREQPRFILADRGRLPQLVLKLFRDRLCLCRYGSALPHDFTQAPSSDSGCCAHRG